MNFPENLNEHEYSDYYNKLANHLPFFRREKAERFRASSGRLQSALAYLLLCHALNKEYPDICSPEYKPTFSIGKFDKPEFDDEQLHFLNFNLSHCRNGIACGLSSSPIGIDIQDIRPQNQRLINKYMSTYKPSGDEEFTMLWSRIEAVGKLLGCGLASSDISEYLSEEYLNKNNIIIISEKKADAFLTSAHFRCLNNSGNHFPSALISTEESINNSTIHGTLRFNSSTNSFTPHSLSNDSYSVNYSTSSTTDTNTYFKCIDIDFNYFVSERL